MTYQNTNTFENFAKYYDIPIVEPETLDDWRNPIILSLNFRAECLVEDTAIRSEAIGLLMRLRGLICETSNDDQLDWLVTAEATSSALESETESMHCFAVTECPDCLDLKRVRKAVVAAWPDTELGLNAKVIAPTDTDWLEYKALVERCI